MLTPPACHPSQLGKRTMLVGAAAAAAAAAFVGGGGGGDDGGRGGVLVFVLFCFFLAPCLFYLILCFALFV